MTYSPVAPMELRWPAGIRGGTYEMQTQPTGVVFHQTGGVLHYASLPAQLHPSLANVPEELPPSDPHLALIISEFPGGSVATFSSVGGQPEWGMLQIGIQTERIKFWSRYDPEFPATVVPSIGEWQDGSGGIPTINIRAQFAPNTVGTLSHVAKHTLNAGGDVKVTTYFVKLGT